MDYFMNKKKTIIKQKNISSEDEEQIDNIDMLISSECSDREYEKLVKVLGELETKSGSSNSTNMWKEFRKAYPKKVRPVPTGVKNVHGKVITNPNEKKHITLKHFRHRMRKRPTHEDTKEIAHIKETTFSMRIEEASKIKSPNFTMHELEKVLKHLKNEKSKDFNGYICELFKEGVVGTDLK